MADRDAWEKAESLSKIFAAIFIPVVLGIAGLLANQALEKSKTRDELLKQAIDVVFLSKSDVMAGADKSFESRRAHRSHWLEIYNSLADVKLSQDFIAVMMEQDTRVDGTELYTIENRPSFISNTERAESANEDEMGHGWVPVGRLIPSVTPKRILPSSQTLRIATAQSSHTRSSAHVGASAYGPTAAIWKIGKIIRAQAAASCGAASAPR